MRTQIKVNEKKQDTNDPCHKERVWGAVPVLLVREMVVLKKT